jgi:DNA topoisomerase I
MVADPQVLSEEKKARIAKASRKLAEALRETPRRRPAIALVPLEPEEAARHAGLHYVEMSPLPPGIRRVKSGKGFRYVAADGSTIKDRSEIKRIHAIVIPPAWTEVWICPSPLGHIQAVGRDARGRKQYRYHARWRHVRDENKYGQLVTFAAMLPAIRRRVRKDLARRGLPREKVIATVVRLLELTMMRIGNEEYARHNRSFGLTTLRGHHATVRGHALTFQFRGKSGKEHRLRIEDQRLSRIVKACQDLPGYELFQYLDDEGKRQTVDSSDVNAYLREITGADVSAKVFRTWAGTVRAMAAMRAWKPAQGAHKRGPSTRVVSDMVKEVARQLGNTPAICRKCYIHPAVIQSFQKGELGERLEELAGHPSPVRGLNENERLTLLFVSDATERARAVA